MRLHLYLLLFTLLPHFIIASVFPDSVNIRLKNAKHDTDKINIIVEHSYFTLRKSPAQAIEQLKAAQQLMDLFPEKKNDCNFLFIQARILSAKSRVQMLSGKQNEAENNVREAIDLIKKCNRKSSLFTLYNHLGLLLSDKGQLPASLESYQNADRIAKELNDNAGMAMIAMNTGILFNSHGEADKAISYYQKALTLIDSVKQLKLLAACYNNMGSYYNGKINMPSKALEYYKRALNLKAILNDEYGVAMGYDNIGSAFQTMRQIDSALFYINKGIELRKPTGDYEGLATSYNHLATLYDEDGNLNEAEKYSRLALENGKYCSLYTQKHLEKNLYDILKKKKKFEEANAHLIRYIELRDSLNNIENIKKLTEKEMSYAFEKKETEMKAEQQRQKVIAAEKEKRQLYIIVFAGLFALMLTGFLIVLFNRFKLIKKQNTVIEKQKFEVEEKNKEIIDSITYAKRIQSALLASDKLLTQNFEEHFVLYKPRDIVSGDFYWATEHQGRFYFILADCTGHGVPGAFMSLLNISKLSETITQKNIIEPHEILNDVRKEIVAVLNQDSTVGKDVKDGMDCVLFCIDKNKKNEISFACANNPLWLCRNKEMIEFKGDKMPVGKFLENEKPFTKMKLTLEPGDIIYLFSDGYADQFGGKQGKKFKYKQFKEELVRHSSQPMEQQKKTINTIMSDWRGDLQQVDDILVGGFKPKL